MLHVKLLLMRLPIGSMEINYILIELVRLLINFHARFSLTPTDWMPRSCYPAVSDRRRRKYCHHRRLHHLRRSSSASDWPCVSCGTANYRWIVSYACRCSSSTWSTWATFRRWSATVRASIRHLLRPLASSSACCWSTCAKLYRSLTPRPRCLHRTSSVLCPSAMRKTMRRSRSGACAKSADRASSWRDIRGRHRSQALLPLDRT